MPDKPREIKTRFPVARIKKLMQSDDDIGKVAQATPTAVAKALELFMISLIEETCNQARMRNSKRVSPSHLKQAVLETEQFDFLQDIVSKHPDAVAPATGEEEQPKRRGRKPAQE
ncbi:DNA polymerase epsilon subunit C [Yarrowia sp. B02]|nr:DNA polymerase epsilon subunit C [Yarrowia sp. B02]